MTWDPDSSNPSKDKQMDKDAEVNSKWKRQST